MKCKECKLFILFRHSDYGNCLSNEAYALGGPGKVHAEYGCRFFQEKTEDPVDD